MSFDSTSKAVSANTERSRMRLEQLRSVSSKLGSEIAQELYNFYSIYDDGLYVWLSGLWEPRIGGFYYSVSARDNDGFLPDIESTAQALRLANGTGLLSAYGKSIGEALPEPTKKSILKFIK